MSMTVDSLEPLLTDISQCRRCGDELPMGPRPVLQAGQTAPILIAGQAPGVRVHKSGIPFADPSGDRLRDWLGVDKQSFYDPAKFAIIPMAFCYPGTGKSGDLPPPPRCAATWRTQLLEHMPNRSLTLIFGRYARDWHLPDEAGWPLTKSIENWQAHWPGTLAAPHPSPRNNRWLKQNPWFETDILPRLKERVRALLGM